LGNSSGSSARHWGGDSSRDEDAACKDLKLGLAQM
jgi:hypothetical protein